MEFCLQTRKPGFRDRKCVVGRWSSLGYASSTCQGDRLWTYLTRDYNWMADPHRAKVFTVKELIENRSSYEINETFTVMLLDEGKLAMEPAQRRCLLPGVMHPVLLALLADAPGNPSVRAHIQAMFGTPIPADCVTFEQVRDWLEFNFDPPKLTSELARNYQRQPQAATSYTDVLNQRPAPAFEVAVSIEEVETGRARYSVTRRNVVHVPIHEQTIQRLIRDGHGMEEISLEVIRIAKDEVPDHDDGEGYGDYDYDDHSTDNTEHISSDVHHPNTRDLIVNFIRRFYGPQEAQEILDR